MQLLEILRKSGLKNQLLFKAIDDSYTTGVTSTDGKNPHRHRYRINKQGTGKTVSTTREGPDHIHGLTKYVVEAGGVDKHIHTTGKEKNV